MSRISKIFWIWIGLLITTQAMANDLVIRHIKLKYKTAQQIIKILEPMLDKNTNLSGQGRNLLIKASPRQFYQLKKLIADLDTKPVVFNVQLRWVRQNFGTKFDHVDHYQTTPMDNDFQSIRVMEGQMAVIANQTLHPIYTDVTGGPFWPGVMTSYKRIGSGIWLTAYDQGKQVKLTYFKKDASNKINRLEDLKKVASTVLIPLNQWKTLGVYETAGHEGSSRDIIYTTKFKKELQIKVQKIHASPFNNL